MSRTLLPPWSVYKQTLGLDVKEIAETFDWMTPLDQHDYFVVRDVLNSTPGAREWIMDCPGGRTYENEYAQSILRKFGSWHSGASAIALANIYRNLLKNWDQFVLEKKTHYARKAYDSKQMTNEHITDFIRTCETFDEANDSLFSHICSIYEIDATQGRAELMRKFREVLDEQAVEKEELKKSFAKRYFDESIATLEWLYKHPYRWNDHGIVEIKCSLFGPIERISEKMFEEMEKRHPGYRAHIYDIRNNGPPSHK